MVNKYFVVYDLAVHTMTVLVPNIVESTPACQTTSGIIFEEKIKVYIANRDTII